MSVRMFAFYLQTSQSVTKISGRPFSQGAPIFNRVFQDKWLIKLDKFIEIIGRYVPYPIDLHMIIHIQFRLLSTLLFAQTLCSKDCNDHNSYKKQGPLLQHKHWFKARALSLDTSLILAH